jgi:hypothetical protein
MRHSASTFVHDAEVRCLGPIKDLTVLHKDPVQAEFFARLVGEQSVSQIYLEYERCYLHHGVLLIQQKSPDPTDWHEQ